MRSGVTSLLFVVVAGLLFTAGCDREEPESALVIFNRQLGLDTVAIDAYLAEHGIVALPDTTGYAKGLRYVIHEEGTGKSPARYAPGTRLDCVEADFLGKLVDGDVPFDTAQAFQTSLNSVIAGWQVGFQYLQEGDSATIYIPSGYAYGTVKRTSIPANSPIYFHVRLRKVVTPEFNPFNGYYECYYDDFVGRHR